MAGHAHRWSVVVAVLLVAGCAGVLPGGDGGPGAGDEGMSATVEPHVASASSTGGQCDGGAATLDVAVTGRTGSAVTIVVAGTIAVPGAHVVVDEQTVRRVNETTFRFEVTTAEDPRKAEQPCPDGGTVRYEATLELPWVAPSVLDIVHDGERRGRLALAAEP